MINTEKSRINVTASKLYHKESDYTDSVWRKSQRNEIEACRKDSNLKIVKATEIFYLVTAPILYHILESRYTDKELSLEILGSSSNYFITEKCIILRKKKKKKLGMYNRFLSFNAFSRKQ